jgi:DNA-binding IclR family transcriptional regulator
MSSYKRIEAVKVAINVLRHLSAQRGPVSGQDVAQALGVPHATVMCHLATLEDEGLVRSVGGAYELGTGMSLFWARYKSQIEAKIERLHAELEQLEI